LVYNAEVNLKGGENMIELNDDSFKPIVGARLIQKEAEDQLKKDEKLGTTERAKVQVVTQPAKKRTSEKKQ